MHRGDTLSAVAQREHRSWIDVAAYNHLSNPDKLMVGQHVKIPPKTFHAKPETHKYLAWAAVAKMPRLNPAIRIAAQTQTVQYAKPVHHVAVVHRAQPVQHSEPVQHTQPVHHAISVVNFGIWSCIAHYESGGDWSINTGNGFYGGLQFTESSWIAAGGLRYASYPQYASPNQQVAVANVLLSMQSWSAWPQTSRECGV